METIVRKHYLDKLSVLKDKNFIKVATGVRRCGKSTLMSQFQELLRHENSNVSIMAINMDMPEFRFLADKNWKEIYDYIIKNLTFLNQEYSSKNILGLQNTSDKYFSNFSIKLDSKIPVNGSGPSGSNIYVDSTTQDVVIELVNLEIDERLEVQISIGGTIYSITLGVIES